MMDSSSDDDVNNLSHDDSEEEETSAPFTDYENPNYRKLYATLSVTTMMGSKVESNADNDTDDDEEVEADETTRLTNDGESLPEGWEKHEDDNGPYYWHIPSGTIQRQVPTKTLSKRDSIFYFDDDGLDKLREQVCKEHTLDENFPGGDDVFTVHSLGWMEFDESSLTPELSSKAIKRCILELTTQTENAVRCWGKEETAKLTLKIENGCLKLLDPISSKVLTIQRISNIRVWGVNDVDDFAYVARDPDSENSLGKPSTPTNPHDSPVVQILKCHVFHCESLGESESSAQKIANLLKEEMIRIKSQQNLPKDNDKGEVGEECRDLAIRPNQLSIEEYTGSPMESPYLEFPTPIEEPRKTIVARYLGKTPVPKPTGVDILNEAIDRIVFDLDKAYPDRKSAAFGEEKEGRGIISLVHISPSTITVESTVDGKILVECRVRYLSFLGISKNNVENCGFILQVDDNLYEVHCFECEPSSGALCKTIEAACKLRFQKCLDAHKQRCSQAIFSGNQPKTTSPVSSFRMKPSQSMGAIKNSLINAFSKLLTKG
ncbi:protein Fe65 homolog [Tetranychus urticae]|uniref:PID domain-containing protein n=1 Tax=Tetranychus urticae TaxID=32264 RepID=T1KS78_TETUR|nr:protein Fe65 homolog [Tetranychus urticae]